MPRLAFGHLDPESIEILADSPHIDKRQTCKGFQTNSRAGKTCNQLKIKLPQERLALMLSLSRQTTNRLLELLETQGIVHLRFGEIEILDMEKLRSAAVTGNSRGA